MSRSLLRLSSALLLSLSLFALGVAAAQVARSVPRGEVSGVDLQIEGRLVAHRGRPMRIGLTAFEVLGLDRLRRAPNTDVTVHASFSRENAVATVRTDARGRALASFVVPDDAPDAFRVVIEARTPSRVVRRFEFGVSVLESRRLEVTAGPRQLLAGSPVQVLGRLVDVVTGVARAGVQVSVSLTGARGPVGSAVTRTTEADGSFTHTFVLPRDAQAGTYTVVARIAGEHPLTAQDAVSVAPRRGAALLVSLAPSRAVVEPRANVALDVVVRRPDGRPVEGATVKTVAPRDEIEEVRTDARGRALVHIRASALASGLRDETLSVQVEKVGLGSASAGVAVRVAAHAYAGRLSFEGGRFAAALGGRVYVRAVGADGRPAAGTPVVLSGPRVRGGEATGTTDAFGVAVIDVALTPPSADAEESDSCGGTVATSIEARIGEGPRAGHVARCLPIDPDGVLRLRADATFVRSGSNVRVELARAGSSARLPLVLEAVVAESGPRRGVVVSSVAVGAEASHATLEIPQDITGTLVLRARLLAGTEAAETRGGATVVVATAGDRVAVDASYDRERGAVDVRLSAPDATLAEDVSVRAYAVPYEDALVALRGYAPDSQVIGPPRRTADDDARGASWRIAQLADTVPTDVVAAHAFVENALVPQPASAEPEGDGRLRDPYRARARFVEGRLSLLFRAIEAYADENIPGNVDNVAHETRGRLELNDAVLSAVAETDSLGPEGATGLGGAPITITQLRALDPSFGFDAIARRVTRKRLFQLLVGLRTFVTQNGFDLSWARPGDARTWVEKMVTEGGSGLDGVDTDTLVDGWGRPFQLVATGNPRFTLLQPVDGFELVSAGPDGRYGNGDDVYDPTARVLASGTLYARAVQEDSLVARLHGVELSRATLGQLGDHFGVYAESVPYDEGDSALRTSEPSAAFPAIVELDPDPLAIRRVARVVRSASVPAVVTRDGRVALPLDLGVEPMSWGVFVVARTASGEQETAFVHAVTGSTAIVHGELPARVHADEPVTVDLAVTSLDSADRRLTLHTTSCDGVRVEVPEALDVGAGRAVVFPAVVRASAIGPCPVVLEVRDGERVLSRAERTVDVTSGLHPERRRVAALVDGGTSRLELAVPSDARRISARVTVVDAASIVELPDLAVLRSRLPQTLAWARVATGKGLDDSLRDALLRVFADPSRRPSSIDAATAIVALSSRPEDELSRTLRDRLLGTLGSAPRTLVTGDADSGGRRVDAATVAALALAGVPDADDASATDPLANFLRAAIPRLRAAIRAEVDSDAELAFCAAALLLADAEDGHGRAMFDRAFAVSRLVGGRRVLDAAPGHEPVEASIAAAAMALAAEELGRHEDAVAFARTALAALPAIARAPDDGPFWLAALSVYGTLVADGPSRAEVRIGGSTATHDFENGRVVLPVTLRAGEHVSIGVRALPRGFVVAEAEVSYERPFVAEEGGPLALALEGDAGSTYGVGAMELGLSASRDVFDPVVEFELPPGVELDPTVEAQLRAAAGVREVEARAGGFVRVRFAAMGAGSTVRIPLALAFTVRGAFTGLAVSAYPASESYLRTVLAPRTFSFGAPAAP